MAVLHTVANENIAYRGKLIEIVQQERTNGLVTKRFEFARRGPGTRIIFSRDDKILIAKEYRYELERFDFRLPGGKVFDTLDDYEKSLVLGDDMLSRATMTIIKEASEEVGLRPLQVDFLTKSVCGATITWDLYYFSCNSWETLGETKQEAGEEIASFDWYDAVDVAEMCMDGRISEDRSAINILRFLRSINK